MKKTLSMLAIMSAVLVSCTKSEINEDNGNNGNPPVEPVYEISISPNDLTFGAEGGKKTLTITAKENEWGTNWNMAGETSWEQTKDKKFWYCESAEWCKVSKTDGYDGDEITFEISSFNSEITEKKCSFTISCGYGDYYKEIELIVTQGIDDSPIIQFSNPDFEKAVIIQADLNVDNKISEAEAAYLKELDLSEKGITDLEDIKYFTGLLSLDCSDNQLTTLDLSTNIGLGYLDCSGNQLTSFDIRKNTALYYLDCYSNQLTSLDVSNNIALRELWCDSNQLSSLNLSNNIALKELYCTNNQLSSLDLSNNVELAILMCWNNQLKILDLRNNFPFDSVCALRCSDNPLERIVLPIANNILYLDEIIKEYGDIITYVD